MIEVASCSIAELFTEKIPNTNIQGKLIIPEYQRPYVWKEKEIRKLTNDLFEYFQQNNEFMYYIGSIILHKKESKLNIIDGQQRITTLAIIQSILDENKVPSINYASPITIKNIKQNHKLLTKILKEKKIDFAKINCTLIVTPNEDDAYTFFETQNTGGIRLSGSDILKAFHLRAIKEEHKRSEFAIKWEAQKKVEEIINYLLKARRWNILDFIEVASHRNTIDTKKQLINDFSEQTQNKNFDIAYHQMSYNLNQSGIRLQMPLHLYSIRQPLNNGENFISFVNSYNQIYLDLFLSKKPTISNDFYNFYDSIIKQIDGTAYLKDFFEISLLIYVSKFGAHQLLEASLWIFRYSYSLRLSNQKTVREDSIPAFIDRKKNYLFDLIISSYTHSDFLIRIKKFSYEINKINLEKGRNTVKNRFVGRVAKYFKIDFNQLRENYDTQLKKAIKLKVNHNG